MSDDRYAPPVAAVSDVLQNANIPPVFYAVSPLKLVVLSFGTMGIYQYYWIYKNWKLHKQRTGEDVSPAPRTLFAVFFIYQLFKQIDGQAEKWNTRRVLAGPLATLWIIASILWKLPDPYWLVTFLAIFVLVPVQQAVNELNARAAPGHDGNARFSGWNWAAVLLGLPFFALAVIGTFFPET